MVGQPERLLCEAPLASCVGERGHLAGGLDQVLVHGVGIAHRRLVDKGDIANRTGAAHQVSREQADREQHGKQQCQQVLLESAHRMFQLFRGYRAQ